MRNILPIERLALFSCALAAVLAVAGSIGFFYPDINAISFTTSHYLGPMLPALTLPLLAGLIYRFKHHRVKPFHSLALLLARFRQAVALALIVFLHFNFKLWAQLLNQNLYDDVYHRIDLEFRTVISAIESINLALTKPLHLWPNAYHDIFVLMFIISFALHAVQTRTWIFDRLVLAVALVLVIGGLSYAIAPACGPFIYEVGNNPFATEVQQHMFHFQRGLIASKGDSYTPEFFVAAVAAMPSLHIAHVLVLFWFACQYIPLLGIGYLIPSLFIFTEAIASHWHYLIDLPAGLLVAAICIFLSNRMVPAANRQQALP